MLALEKIIFYALRALGADLLFRYLNRNKILILAYHGITKSEFKIPPWVLFPVNSFEIQMRFLRKKYCVLGLQEVINAIQKNISLPRNIAVVTFDDGYRNNLTLALPILIKYNIPASIFLTTGYIGTDKLLPLDRAYLILTNSQNKQPLFFKEIGLGPLFFDNDESILASYLSTVEALKNLSTEVQEAYLEKLKTILKSDYERSDVENEFKLLSWEEVDYLAKNDLIEIGAHTQSHEILSNVSIRVAEKEILNSKTMIECHLSRKVISFAYPNGTLRDFNEFHSQQLKNIGFVCSMTTVARLNQYSDNRYELGRISIGPIFANNLNHFALTISGCNLAMKNLLRGCSG